MTSIINNSNNSSALLNTLEASESMTMSSMVYSTQPIDPMHAMTYLGVQKSSGTVADNSQMHFNIPKMGVIGYLDVSEDKYDIENSPILFIIPSGYIEDIESLKVGMKIEVIVLQSRIKYKSKQIQVVGKLSKYK